MKAPAGNKYCKKCEMLKSISEFYPDSRGTEGGLQPTCKQCRKEYAHNRWVNNSGNIREKQYGKYKEWYDGIKKGVFDHYGRKCVCCGEERWEFLTIDHINGGGTKHRKLLGGGTSFFKWLRDSKYPNEFRVLCINCNFSMGRFGYCPHQKEQI